MGNNLMFVFLGNPGKQYEKNRHNAGRLLLESMKLPITFRSKFKSLFYAGSAADIKSGGDVQNNSLYMLQPETFMNLSGDAVGEAAAFYKITPENIIVFHDELELPLGKAVFKFGGGLGGHNGLRSIKSVLGTADFWRLRIGIGRPAPKGEGDVLGWVLSDFTQNEFSILNGVFNAAASALQKADFSNGFAPAELMVISS